MNHRLDRTWTRRGGAAATALLLTATALVGIVAAAGPAAAATFSNPASVTIPDASCSGTPGQASIYPTNITVAGLTGTVSKVTATLTGLNSDFEGDLEVLLVSPAGGTRNLELLSDAGTGKLTNQTITFDDASAFVPPQNTGWGTPNATITAKPTNYTEVTGADVFPAPAPAPSSNTTLASAFNGINPNGTWSLYIIDDACGDVPQTLTGGWSLDITTVSGAATTTTVTSSSNPSRTGTAVTFTATVTSGGSPVTTGTVTFTDGANTLAAGVSPGGSGTASVTTAGLTEGDHVITASYNGTAAFNVSSGTVNQRVDNNTTVTGSTYCNTGPITVPATGTNGIAGPYPSNIFVTGFAGTVGKVTVSLKNVSHPFAGDVEALLVGPTGQNLVVVSDAGTLPVSNVTVNLDDAAASKLPQNGSWAAANSTISAQPTDYVELTADSFPAPAPAPSAATTLATFNNTNPNGTWSLYVVDDGAGDAGSIAGGWCLTLTAAKASPTISTQASGGVVLGSAVRDVATVSGGASPSGTVTFNLFGPSDATCAGAAVSTSTTALSGGTATSADFTPSTAGTYRWTALYNGDTANNTATSGCNAANESVTVTPTRPTVTTTASAGGPLGTAIQDTAVLTGAVSPTGGIVFNLYGPNDAACAAPFVFTNTVTVNGNGTYTSASFTPTSVGVYRWTARYGGDANNLPANTPCNDTNESATIGKASPTISTQASTTVTAGGTIRDVATLTGGTSPTGTVTFSLFGPNDSTCASAAVFTSTNNVAGGSATSGDFTPASVGTYRWTAVYSGDTNNNGVTSGCNAANESVAITKASPTFSTQASAPSGGTIRDVATLTGGTSPTGTVAFSLFGPNDSTCATAAVFTSTNNVAGGSATSGDFTPASAGTYRWTAVYSGDANNNGATSPCNAANESVTLTKASPTISTQATLGGPVGTSVADTATLAGGLNPTGTVVFSLFGPNNPNCAGAAVFTSTNGVSGGSASSGGFSPASPGTYLWTAVYGGDANNNGATSSCGAANESVVIVKASPALSTQASSGGAIGVAVRDTATISGGASPTGNVAFKLFGPSDPACSGTAVFTSPASVTAGAAVSGSFTPTAPGTYLWTAVYSGDANNNGATSSCGAANESVVVARANPTIATTASPGSTIGGQVSDTATVTGGSNPTGTVAFSLFGPNDATCANPAVFSSTSALSGGSATSGSFTPAPPGTYRWTAVYSGDANNNSATSGCNAANESVTIVKASPSISTQASAGNLLGAPVRDVATLGGGFGATGSVVFNLFSDSTCATQVFSSTNPVTGTTTATSDWFTPAAVGTYYWTAAYSGDANNFPASSACGAPNESVVIAPFVAPAPTRTITGDFVGPLTVNNGESVLITNARVVGPVTVNPGGSLSVVNSQISRGIVADNPRFLSICGASVSGPSPGQALGVSNAGVPIRIGDPANGCAGNRFAGDVNLTSNLAVTFGANVVSNNVTVNNDGPGGTVIKANNVTQALNCSGNNPPPTNAGQPNTAGSKTGQCTGL